LIYIYIYLHIMYIIESDLFLLHIVLEDIITV